MFDDDSELIHQVYPWSTHKWVQDSPEGSRPERHVCARCKAIKVVWNDINVVIYDADGNFAEDVRCEFHGIAKVMES